MSKKNKAKFKKQIKAQILNQLAQTAPQTQTAPIASAPAVTNISAPAQAAVLNAAGLENLGQIKYDLKKTGIVVGCLALIIVALVLLDQKYNILLTSGSLLFKVLNIQ